MTNYTPAQLEAWAGLGPWTISPLVTPPLIYSDKRHGGTGLWIASIYADAPGEREHHKTNAALIAAAPDLARLVLEKDAEIARLKADLERYKAFIFEPNYLKTSAAKAIRNCELGPSDKDGSLYLYDIIPEEWCAPDRLAASDEMAERLADIAIGQWIVDARQAMKETSDE